MEYGIVLEGGGARGAYQIGVWKALRELGIELKGIVGTSVGALNGAMMAQGEFDTAYDMWKNMKYSLVMDVDDELFERIKNLSIGQEDIKDVVKGASKLIKNAGFDITPLRNLIHETLHEDKIREKGLDYGLVTFSLTDFKPMELFLTDIPDGLFEDFLMASAYLPVFKGEKLHGKRYLDGGFYNNLPIKMLIDRGYKDILVVRIHGLGHIPRYEVPEDVNVIYIEPKESLGGTMDFSCTSTCNNLELGYYDTLRIFKHLKGNQYYIDSQEDESFYIHCFSNIPDKAKKWLIKQYGNEKLHDHRNMFELILPQLAKRLRLEGNWNYEDLMLAIHEHVASLMDIDRFHVYSLDELQKEILLGQMVKKNDSFLNKILDERFDKVMTYLCRNWKWTLR